MSYLDEILMIFGAFGAGMGVMQWATRKDTLNGVGIKPVSVRQWFQYIGVLIAGILLAIFGSEAHGLTPHPSPDWLPGQDVVVWSKYGTDDAATLDGTHCTVTDLRCRKGQFTYEVNCQGWGDFRTYGAEQMVTRPKWEAMQRAWIKERNYPSWWMPVFKDLEQ